MSETDELTRTLIAEYERDLENKTMFEREAKRELVRDHVYRALGIKLTEQHFPKGEPDAVLDHWRFVWTRDCSSAAKHFVTLKIHCPICHGTRTELRLHPDDREMRVKVGQQLQKLENAQCPQCVKLFAKIVKDEDRLYRSRPTKSPRWASEVQ